MPAKKRSICKGGNAACSTKPKKEVGKCSQKSKSKAAVKKSTKSSNDPASKTKSLKRAAAVLEPDDAAPSLSKKLILEPLGESNSNDSFSCVFFFKNWLLFQIFFTEGCIIDSDWKKLLQSEFEASYWKTLAAAVEAEYSGHTVYPPRDLVFNAFNTTPFKQVLIIYILNFNSNNND